MEPAVHVGKRKGHEILAFPADGLWDGLTHCTQMKGGIGGSAEAYLGRSPDWREKDGQGGA